MPVIEHSNGVIPPALVDATGTLAPTNKPRYASNGLVDGAKAEATIGTVPISAA